MRVLSMREHWLHACSVEFVLVSKVTQPQWQLCIHYSIILDKNNQTLDWTCEHSQSPLSAQLHLHLTARPSCNIYCSHVSVLQTQIEGMLSLYKQLYAVALTKYTDELLYHQCFFVFLAERVRKDSYLQQLRHSKMKCSVDVDEILLFLILIKLYHLSS